MKNVIFATLLLLMMVSCSSKESPPTKPLGKTVKAADGLYEFTLTGPWKEHPNPGPKIDKMFITPDNLGRFFVLRIANPPHESFTEEQLQAYIEGLDRRYKNLKVTTKKIHDRAGQSVGTVIFTYDEDTPKGPLTIRNLCEVVIHKKNYFNICGVAPASVWESKREKILKIFPSLKFL